MTSLRHNGFGRREGRTQPADGHLGQGGTPPADVEDARPGSIEIGVARTALDVRVVTK